MWDKLNFSPVLGLITVRNCLVSAATNQLPVIKPLAAPPQHRLSLRCGVALVLMGITCPGQQEGAVAKRCHLRACWST